MNSRLHVKHVFDSHGRLLEPGPLLVQLLFGPGHVDAILHAGSCPSLSGCRMGRGVPVMDQLSLNQEIQRDADKGSEQRRR